MKRGLTRLGRTALVLAALVGLALAVPTWIKVLCAAYILGNSAAYIIGDLLRLDRGPKGLTMARKAARERRQAVRVRRGGAGLDASAVGVEDVVVEPLAAKIQSDVQH
jgi:hypothetical protein